MITIGRYVHRSILFYMRTHLGIILGAAIGAAILTGAFAVGDSVHYSLRHLALARLGRAGHAIHTPNRFFRWALADDMAKAHGGLYASVLNLPCTAAKNDGSARVNQIQLLGVDATFWTMGDTPNPLTDGPGNGVAINSHLARRLGLQAGDTFVLRVEKPSPLPRDALMAMDQQNTLGRSVTVTRILADSQFGRFSLQANQVAPFNVFVRQQWLADLTGLQGKANTLLAGELPEPLEQCEDLQAQLKQVWQPADMGLQVNAVQKGRMLKVSTERIFLEAPVVDAIRDLPGATGILTYFVNAITRLGGDGEPVSGKQTPYSFVSAIGPLSATTVTEDAPYAIFPQDKGARPIAISRWLADDLGIEAGAQTSLALRYFVSGPMRTLKEAVTHFTVQAILPQDHPALDPGLMPRFPGLADVDRCIEWDPGIDIDFDQIRDHDEDYWKKYKGTPKAFIPLATGEAIWSDRFGTLTAVHLPGGEQEKEGLVRHLLTTLSPAQFGLQFQPVRALATRAASQALDFGQLFLGLSFFLLAAGLILNGLLFMFSMEQRTEEIGTLAALGLGRNIIRKILITEGLALSSLGALAGIFCGMIYAKVVLYGLATVWQGAVGTSAIQFHADAATLLKGFVLGVLASLLAMFLSLRGQLKKPVRMLLNLHFGEDTQTTPSGGPSLLKSGSLLLGLAAIAAAAALSLMASQWDAQVQTHVFFSAGGLLLTGMLCLCHTLLLWLARKTGTGRLTLTGLSLRNMSRNRFRSLAVVGLLAFGSFVLVSVSAYRRNVFPNTRSVTSGTGGYELVGDATIPLYRDLNSKGVRKSYGLEGLPQSITVLPFRVRSGDDASCLNMNRSQTPRILAVDARMLAKRNAFTFLSCLPGNSEPASGREACWSVLTRDAGTEVIPVVGDVATITWGLHKKLGDVLTYQDEKGRTFKLQIAGIIARSVFQGGLLMDEARFLKRFPSESGYRLFLMDLDPPEQAATDETMKIISRAFEDIGMAVTTTDRKLASFSIVENTYLAIFQALGGLGLILGSVGLGIVLMRNVMERRNEFALLRAVGFRRSALKGLVLMSHWALVVMGMTCGIAAALVAVLPSLLTPGNEIPFLSLGGIIALAMGNGIAWTLVAASLALRGPLLNALRNE